MGLQENLLRGIYAYGMYWKIDHLILSAYSYYGSSVSKVHTLESGLDLMCFDF